jgi:hypothetical protein
VERQRDIETVMVLHEGVPDRSHSRMFKQLIVFIPGYMRGQHGRSALTNLAFCRQVITSSGRVEDTSGDVDTGFVELCAAIVEVPFAK